MGGAGGGRDTSHILSSRFPAAGGIKEHLPPLLPSAPAPSHEHGGVGKLSLIGHVEWKTNAFIENFNMHLLSRTLIVCTGDAEWTAWMI